jgi:hypothetical protein
VHLLQGGELIKHSERYDYAFLTCNSAMCAGSPAPPPISPRPEPLAASLPAMEEDIPPRPPGNTLGSMSPLPREPNLSVPLERLSGVCG